MLTLIKIQTVRMHSYMPRGGARLPEFPTQTLGYVHTSSWLVDRDGLGEMECEVPSSCFGGDGSVAAAAITAAVARPLITSFLDVIRCNAQRKVTQVTKFLGLNKKFWAHRRISLSGPQ